MKFSHFNQKYPKFLFIAFALLFPFVGHSAKNEEVNEKRIAVAMRVIGHEVLLCLGDNESRVMPIEKIDDHYKISFEFEFGFDPSDMVSIINQVMAETGIAYSYLVEVEQCETKEVVHTYEVRNVKYSDLLPCGGRFLPEDCYSILITILDDIPFIKSQPGVSGNSPSKTKKFDAFKSTFIIVPLLIVVGFLGFSVRKKNPSDTDPDLILVGASRFDKRKMTLSFKDKTLELSNKETELLALLHSAANTTVEREVILQKVWEDEGDYIGRTLDVFISKLRKKLEGDTSVKIVNIRGVGYKLVMDLQK